VVAEVTGVVGGRQVELRDGRMVELTEGDRVVGALGSRFATLEVTGSWEEVGDDGRLHLLTAGGLLGRMRSLSTLVTEPAALRYAGHVLAGGRRATMDRYVTRPSAPRDFTAPVVLLIGTSMSAGKTTAARVVIRRLRNAGLRVLGAKVAGAGRYRDILGMADAGADTILDFVDAGLPSTHCPAPVYGEALEILLGRMAAVEADVAVVEAGASPLEPYNGAMAVERLRSQVAFTLLCASDPYAVKGAMDAYDLRPDLVTGATANTEAGVQLATRLSGVPVLDLRRRESWGELDRLLLGALGRWGSGEP
jgi:hypothetical protein